MIKFAQLEYHGQPALVVVYNGLQYVVGLQNFLDVPQLLNLVIDFRKFIDSGSAIPFGMFFGSTPENELDKHLNIILDADELADEYESEITPIRITTTMTVEEVYVGDIYRRDTSIVKTFEF